MAPHRWRAVGSCLLPIVVLALCCAVPVRAFYFYVAPTGTPVCFAHDATPDASTITIHYSTGAKNMPLQVEVRDSKKTKVLQHKDAMLGSGDDTLQVSSAEGGKYDICFTIAPSSQPQADRPVQMSLDVSEALDKDYRDPAIVLSDYHVVSERMRGMFMQLEDESQYLATRQERFEATVHSTHARVTWFTIIEVVVVVCVVGWQILYLRNLFKAKKLV